MAWKMPFAGYGGLNLCATFPIVYSLKTRLYAADTCRSFFTNMVLRRR